MNSFKTITLEQTAAIAMLTIQRPKMLNALSSEVLAEISIALDLVSKDKATRVLIVTGSGEKSFVAGADIAEMKDKDNLAGRDFSAFGNKVFAQLANLRQPTIAAVNGFALGGGCELALACDMRIGAKNAKFGQPEVGLGILPGFGGTQRLTRLIGIGRAKELIFTGATITAEEAYRIGLINQIVALPELLPEVKRIAQKIIKNAPLAVESSKKVINAGAEMELTHALSLEIGSFGNLFSTQDQTEGMTAFIEKRPANFKRK